MSDIRYSVPHRIGHYEVNEPFWDCFITVIESFGEDVGDVDCDRFIQLAEYDEPYTLDRILEEYPNVCTVIVEDALGGAIYRYGNACDGKYWEKIGETCGYA